MNILRITTNIALSGLLFMAGLHILSVDSYALHGLLFAGLARYLLAASLMFMVGFVGAIAYGWIRGSIPKPPASSFRFDPTYVHPAYKGEMLVRYWYLVLPALICLVLAFVFAGNVPDTALHLSAIPLALHGGRGA